MKGEVSSTRSSAATEMVRHAREVFDVMRDGAGQFWAAPKAGGDPMKFEDFGLLLARHYERATRRVPPAATKKSALEVLAADEVPMVDISALLGQASDGGLIDDRTRVRLEEAARELLAWPELLPVFRRDLTAMGWVGPTTAPELIFVNSYTSQLDVGDYKPVKRIGSIRVSGLSSAGKNFAVDRTRVFFPKDLFHMVTSSSEKALLYSEVDLRRRFLYYPEGAALANDGVGAALLRSLLTENVAVHETVIDGKHVRLECEGPIGVVIATSRLSLDRDLENRLDRVEVSDSSELTRLVIDSVSESARSGDWDPPDLERWHAFFNLLRSQGPYEVIVPYAVELGAAIPATAIRLRRDISQLIGLIWAHAVMHQWHRERDDNGRIVATLEDYGAVRPLINAGIGIATGQSVPNWMHETWRALVDTDGVTYRELGNLLHLGDDGARKRVQQMIPLGYVENRETRPRAAAQIVRRTEPPQAHDAGFLPTVSDVVTHVSSPPEVGPAGHVRGGVPGVESTTDQPESDSESDLDLGSRRPESDFASDPAPPDLETNPRAALRTGSTRPAELASDPSSIHTVGKGGSLDVVLTDPDLFAQSGLDKIGTLRPMGRLIGTCSQCHAGIGDRDPTVGYYSGEGWKYTGYGLPTARAAHAAEFHLCCSCAVGARYRLITPPDPDPMLGTL